MNLEYILLAAEAYERDGKNAERSGHADAAAQYYAKAAKKYRQAAELCPSRRNEFSSCAARLENARSNVAVENNEGKRARGCAQTHDKAICGAVVRERCDKSEYGAYDLNIIAPDEDLIFDDLIGLNEAKETIHKSLIYPMQNPESFKKYKLGAGGFILLYGPPGTGKTFFAKVAASAISVPFINVDCTALVDSLIGKTAKRIDELFAEVRRFTAEQCTPVIMFLDEIDSLAKSRVSGNKTAEEAVPSLLRQLDGFGSDNGNISIIAATNVVEQIDKAVLSRFNKKIFVPLPDAEARKALFETGFKKHNVDEKDILNVDLERVAIASNGLSGRDIAKIVDEFVRGLAMRDSGIPVDIISSTETILTLIAKR